MIKMTKLIQLLLFVCALHLVSSLQQYKELISEDYNRDVIPTVDGQPVRINVSIIVLSLKPDLHAQMSFSIDLFYHMRWKDYRLKGPADSQLSLGPHWKEKLWLPGIHFRNVVTNKIPAYLSESTYFVITNATDVFLSTRFQMKVSCDMSFFKFPFDRQICSLNISTLYQPIEKVKLFWGDEGFRLSKRVILPEYQIVEGEYSEYNKTYPHIGCLSHLYVTTHLKRNIGKYLIKRYIPSTLIVCMSFIGFWIPTQGMPARVSLIITALLALIAQQIQGELNISYIYALEVYTILCIVFVFATLIEYAIAVSWPHDPNPYKANIVSGAHRRRQKSLFSFTEPNERNCIVDVMARSIFPSIFALCIITYSLFYYFA